MGEPAMEPAAMWHVVEFMMALRRGIDNSQHAQISHGVVAEFEFMHVDVPANDQIEEGWEEATGYLCAWPPSLRARAVGMVALKKYVDAARGSIINVCLSLVETYLSIVSS
jgi:hypothetical protein